MDLGNRTEDSTIDFKWNTNSSTGASITRATNGTISVYKGNNVTQSTAGVTDTEDFDGLTGVHHIRIDLSADAFYVADEDYDVVLSAATIDGVTVNHSIAHFRIERGFNEVDVTKWLGQAVAAVTNNGVPEVDVTHIAGAAVSTSSAQLGVNVVNAAGTAWNSGAIGAATVATDAIDADALAADAIAEINATLDAALADIHLDHLIQSADPGAIVANNSLWAKLHASAATADYGDFDHTSMSLQAIGGFAESLDTVDLPTVLTRLGTPSNLGSGATLSANLVDIEGQTDDIGVAGAGLTAIPWNAAYDAEVQSEVDDALKALFLDKLILVSGTADSGTTTTMVDAARTEGDADYWKGRILRFTSGNIAGQCAIITDFNAGTDTFTFAPATTQAVATQDYVILPGVSVWDDVLAEHLASGSTGNALNAAGSAGDPMATAVPGAYGAGTAGHKIGNFLTGDAYVRLGAPVGASIAADIGTVGTSAATILARIGAFTGSGVNTILGFFRALLRADLAAPSDVGGTYDPASDSQEAGADALANVQADTNDLQGRLPAALVGGRMASDAVAISGSTAAADAVEANIGNLDTAVSGLATSLTTIMNRLGAFTGSGVNTVLGLLRALARKDGGITTPSDIGGTFDHTTDSHEALRDRGDAAWITATGFSTHTAADVWAAATRTLTAFSFSVTVGTNNDKAGYALTSGERTSIADVVLARGASNVDLAGAAQDSIAAMSMATFESSRSGTNWAVRHSDGTAWFTKTLTVDAAADPVTGVT